MHIPRKYILAGATFALLGAGVAQAATAKLHTMQVNAPNGEVVQVHYTGDVAPQVRLVPATSQAVAMTDPFAEMEQVSAMMDAQMQAMMEHAALMQQAAQTGNVPQGMHVTYYSASTDAKGCTRSVSYSSDGGSAQPKLTQAASDNCESAAPNDGVIQAKVQGPAPARAPGLKI